MNHAPGSLLTILVLAATARGGDIIQPVDVTSSVGEIGSSYAVTHLIDKSGFSPGEEYNAGDDFDTYLAGAPTHDSATAGNFWGGQGTSADLDFDLGGRYLVESLALWNANGTGAINDFRLLASTSADFSGATVLGVYAASQSLNPAQVFDFPPTVASFIRLEVQSNHGHSSMFAGEVILASWEESGVGYCFGDPGSGTVCPCSNDNDGSVPGSGCANGFFASGAQLIGGGVASVTNDTLVLSTAHLEPSNSGLYFQADNDLSPGIVWGDGLQCAGGNLKRLGVRFADASGYSDTSGYPHTISAKAGNVVPGDTKYYQCWYRNPNGSPCGAEFNASNGYAVTWMP